jgi:purine-nucleoside phosphorylase
MLYIVVALKPEAQAFVDRYKLKKSKLGDFTLFSDDNMMLIISGVGVKNSTLATQTLINNYDITDDDIYLNVGICGADKSYEIGELLEIGAIEYHLKTIKLQSKSKKVLTCLDREAKDNSHSIVDMESFGFYDALIHSPAIKNYHILKVVSDHFEPEKITKEGTKSLVFNVIDKIVQRSIIITT